MLEIQDWPLKMMQAESRVPPSVRSHRDKPSPVRLPDWPAVVQCTQCSRTTCSHPERSDAHPQRGAPQGAAQARPLPACRWRRRPAGLAGLCLALSRCGSLAPSKGLWEHGSRGGLHCRPCAPVLWLVLPSRGRLPCRRLRQAAAGRRASAAGVGGAATSAACCAAAQHAQRQLGHSWRHAHCRVAAALLAAGSVRCLQRRGPGQAAGGGCPTVPQGGAPAGALRQRACRWHSKA